MTKAKLNGLNKLKVFKYIKYDPTKFKNIKIFKAKLVHIIKKKITNNLIEKLKIIICAYNNKKKAFLLTTLLTILKFMQRIL